MKLKTCLFCGSKFNGHTVDKYCSEVCKGAAAAEEAQTEGSKKSNISEIYDMMRDADAKGFGVHYGAYVASKDSHLYRCL